MHDATQTACTDRLVFSTDVRSLVSDSQLGYRHRAAINIFTDVLFASLPIPVILTLQVNVRTKATLIAILSIGYLYVEIIIS
jgi:hypothetical protein